jgi:hypothetical protein
MCVQAQKGWLHQLAELVPEPQVLLFFSFSLLCSFFKARKGWIHQHEDMVPDLFFLPLILVIFLILRLQRADMRMSLKVKKRLITQGVYRGDMANVF